VRVLAKAIVKAVAEVTVQMLAVAVEALAMVTVPVHVYRCNGL